MDDNDIQLDRRMVKKLTLSDLSVLILACGALFTTAYSASDLRFVPDSVEYASGAIRLIHGQGYSLDTGQGVYPPRYLPWFSLYLAPWYLLPGADPGSGIFGVTLLAVLGVLAAARIGTLFGGRAGGLASAALVLFTPSYLTLGRSIMADVPVAALWLIVLSLEVQMLASPSVSRGRRLIRPLQAACVALAFAFRPLSAALLLPLVVAILRGPERAREKLAAILGLVLPTAAVGIANMVYDARTFGSVWRTGYHFWVSVPYDFPGLTFSHAYVRENAKILLVETGIVQTLLFWGAFLLPAPGVAPKGAVDLPQLTGLVRRQVLLFVGIAVAPLVTFHLFYFYRDIRFFLPAAVLVAAIGGGALGGQLSNLPLRGLTPRTALVTAILVVLALRYAGVPDERQPLRRVAAEAINRGAPRDAIVVSGLDPVYLSLFLDGKIPIPISRRVEYASKLIMSHPPAVDHGEPPGPLDHRWPGLIASGAKEAIPVVGVESLGWIDSQLASGRRVFLDTAFLDSAERHSFDGRYSFEPLSGQLLEFRPGKREPVSGSSSPAPAR